MPIALAIIYLGAIYIVPLPAGRKFNRWLSWLPHRLLVERTPLRVISYQIWIVALVGLAMLAAFLEGQWGGLINFVLTTLLVGFTLDCFWMRRGETHHERRDAFLDRVAIGPFRHGILVGTEASLIKLSSLSRPLAEDLKQIGIEGFRLTSGRYLPGTLPEGIAYSEIPTEVHDALLAVFQHLEGLVEKQAQDLLDVRADLEAANAQVLTLETTVQRLEEARDNLQQALQHARQTAESPFARSFETTGAEVRALLDRINNITGGTHRDLVEQMQQRITLTAPQTR
jgi:hypothetical protein